MRIRPGQLLVFPPMLWVCVTFTGCVPIRFSEYHGQDASSYFGTWPTGPGSMVETSFSLPVYRGWPERPYYLLGSLSFPDPNKSWDDGIVSAAASEAKHQKADAIVIRQGAEFGVSKIAGAKNDPWVLWSTYQTTALAVRWLTQGEIQEHKRLVA